METKKKSKTWLIIVIFALLLAGIGGYYYYTEYYEEDTGSSRKKDKDKDKDKDTDDDDEEEEEHEVDALTLYKGLKALEKEEAENKLVVYKDKGTGSLCTQKMQNGYCDTKALEIDVVSKKTSVLAVLEDKYILYLDKVVKLYDIDSKAKYEVNIDSDFGYYELIGSQKGKPTGVIYATKDGYDMYDYGYYNFETDKKSFESKYDRLGSLIGDYLVAYEYDDIEDDDYSYEEQQQFYKVYVINKNTGEELLKTTGECASFFPLTYKGGFYIEESHDCLGSDNVTIYTSSLKKILTDAKYGEYSINEDGTIYYYEGDKILKYSTKGKVIDTIDADLGDDFIMMINNYVLAVNDDKLVLINVDKDDTITVGDWDDEYSVHTLLSGYYAEDVLQNETEKEAGIYIIVSYGVNEEYEEYGVEYYINPKNGKVKKYELDMIGGYAKPVLYLYPEKETKVKVNFEHEEDLTTTYPKFIDEWEVTAKPNGDLYDKDGKYYYGLYWEEKKNHDVNFEEGFYVTKDNAIDFLEEKLTTIGLNDRERNEFIMYWLPILEKNGNSVVYFELTEERDAYNKLEITPQPDAVLRLAMHVKKVTKPVSIKEQKLPTFKRTGFVAVEWGGVIHK